MIEIVVAVKYARKCAVCFSEALQGGLMLEVIGVRAHVVDAAHVAAAVAPGITAGW